MRKRKSKNPGLVAITIFAMLSVSLIMYLASIAVMKQVATKNPQGLWAPPGWVGPTSPPPSHR